MVQLNKIRVTFNFLYQVIVVYISSFKIRTYHIRKKCFCILQQIDLDYLSAIYTVVPLNFAVFNELCRLNKTTVFSVASISALYTFHDCFALHYFIIFKHTRGHCSSTCKSWYGVKCNRAEWSHGVE